MINLIVNTAAPDQNGLLNSFLTQGQGIEQDFVRGDIMLAFMHRPVVPNTVQNGFPWMDDWLSTDTFQFAIGNPDTIPTGGTFVMGVQRLITPAIASIAISNPANVHCVGHACAVGDIVFIAGNADANVNGRAWSVYSVIDADHFTIQYNETSTSAGGTLTSYNTNGLTGLAYNISASTLGAALSTASATEGYPTLTAALISTGNYEITWSAPGAVPSLYAGGGALLPASSASIAAVVAGNATTNALQVLELQQLPVAYTDAATPLPVAAITASVHQSGSAGPPAVDKVYTVTMTEGTYAGTFSISVKSIAGDVTTFIEQSTISAFDLQTDLNTATGITAGDISVTRTDDSFAIQFGGTQEGSNTPTITVSNIDLVAPLGVTGNINLNTVNLYLAFAQTTASTLSYTFAIRRTRLTGEDVEYFQHSVTLKRSIINVATMVPVSLPVYYTKQQTDIAIAAAVDATQAIVPHGAVFDGTTDDTAAIQAVLDAGQSVLIPARKTAVVNTLQFKFHHQTIEGFGQSILKVTSSSGDAIKIVSPFAGADPLGGGGANGCGLRNLILLGPGTYNSGTGAFSGSTGYGFRANNAGNTYAGDFLWMDGVQIYGFAKGIYLNGYANCNFDNIDIEKCGTCFESGGATGSTLIFNGITIASFSNFGMKFGAGQGIVIQFRDANKDPAGAGATVALATGVRAKIDGGNFEGTGTGTVITLASDSYLEADSVTIKLAGGSDTGPVVVTGNATFTPTNFAYEGTADIVSGGSDSGNVVGLNTNGTMTNASGLHLAINSLPAVRDNSIPGATALPLGALVRIEPASGGGDPGFVGHWTYDASGTRVVDAIGRLYLLRSANTFSAAQTFTGSIMLPALGGSLGSQSGGIYFNSKWRLGGSLQDAGDFNFIYPNSVSGSDDRLYLDGANNRTHIGFSTANTTPTGTSTLNVYGTLSVTGAATFGSIAGYPKIVANTLLLAQSATVSSVTAYTTPNDSTNHPFEVAVIADVTAISAGTLTVTAAFTDENNTSRTVTFFGMGLTSAGITGTGYTAFPPALIWCKPNTAITVIATFTGVSVTYDVGGVITSKY